MYFYFFFFQLTSKIEFNKQSVKLYLALQNFAVKCGQHGQRMTYNLCHFSLKSSDTKKQKAKKMILPRLTKNAHNSTRKRANFFYKRGSFYVNLHCIMGQTAEV